MMGTYEIVVAFLSSHYIVSPSSTAEVTTLETRKVLLNRVDSEANATSEAEL